MPREIKFRFWSVKDKRMILQADVFSSKDLVEDEDWKVMQFTGLHDRNGKEIYEGDIVKAWSVFNDSTDDEENNTTDENDKITCEVTYDMGGWFLSQELNGEYLETLASDSVICEVIGNIHENPELLEMKEV